MDSNNMFTNNNDDMYKKIRSSLMINRILLIANLVFVTVLLIGAGFVGYKGIKIAKGLAPVYETLTNIDYDKITVYMDTFEEINNINFEEIGKSIESIDFENIANLVNSIDVEEIQGIMENIKDASDMLATVNEKVAPVLKWFK